MAKTGPKWLKSPKKVQNSPFLWDDGPPRIFSTYLHAPIAAVWLQAARVWAKGPHPAPRRDEDLLVRIANKF